MKFSEFEGGRVGEVCFVSSFVGFGLTIVPTTFDLQMLSAAVESGVLNSRSKAMDFWRFIFEDYQKFFNIDPDLRGSVLETYLVSAAEFLSSPSDL